MNVEGFRAIFIPHRHQLLVISGQTLIQAYKVLGALLVLPVKIPRVGDLAPA